MTTTTPTTLPRPVLLARPLGYAAITLIYAVLFAVMVLAWVAPYVLIDRGFGDDFDGPGLVYGLLTVVIAGPILGMALVLVTGVTLSLTLLGGLACVRSLRPRYAGTPLTGTVRSDSVIGPPRRTSAAASLLPTVPSRFADACLRLNLASYGGSWSVAAGGAWIGVADLLTVGWFRWPVTGPWVAVWALASVVLAGLGVRTIVRGERPASGRRRTDRYLP